MQKQRKMLSRFLRVALPMVLLAVILLIGAQVKPTSIGPDADLIYVRARITDIPVDYSMGQPFTGLQKVTATVTSGAFKGRTCELDNPNTYHLGAYGQQGTRIIALVQPSETGVLTGSVYNHDRTGMVYLLLGMFALVTVLIGGKKGAATLYALAFTFVCLLAMYIPMLYSGVNGIAAAIVTALTVLAASLYILNGWSRKTLYAIVGTCLGVAVSGLTAMAVGGAFHLSGYNMEEVESLIYIADHSSLQIGDVLYAGVLISSLGAVMDVSVSIVAAMDEVRQHSPNIGAKDLFRSGMRVGKDMIGTMSNTLILAYTGSATGILMSVYAYEMPYLKMISYNPIIIEILCGLCGTVGVILTVPIQAAITAFAPRKKENSKAADGSSKK